MPLADLLVLVLAIWSLTLLAGFLAGLVTGLAVAILWR